MDLREQFTGFYEAITTDPRITPLHISMYMAIVHGYILQSNDDPVQVNRDMIMLHAKIFGRSTYYKSLNELHEFGYIRYVPSYNYYLGSLVYLKRI